MPKFSIITPVTYDKDNADNVRMPRYEMFIRCANSVKNQSFKDFEWIVADDVCNPSIEELLFESMNFDRSKTRVVKLPEKQGRMYARNAGMREAQGEWICWLDADDEYATFYLQAINEAIALHPEAKVFNFNHLIFAYDYKTSVRKFIDMSVQKDMPFPSGTIGAGAFVFHKSVLDDVGFLPEMGLWEFTEYALNKFPELKPFYAKNDGSGNFNSLGNPWGDDFFYFYSITRKFKSKYLDFAPYFVHSRWGHRWPDDPNYLVDPGKAPEFNPKNI